MECHKSEALSTVDRGTKVPSPLPILTRASRGLVSEPHGAVFAAGGKRTPSCPTQGRTLPSGDHAAEGRGGKPFRATPGESRDSSWGPKRRAKPPWFSVPDASDAREAHASSAA